MAGKSQSLSTPVLLPERMPLGDTLGNAEELRKYEERERGRFLDDELGEFFGRQREQNFFPGFAIDRDLLRTITAGGLRTGVELLLEERGQEGGSLYQLVNDEFGMQEIEFGRCFAAGVAAHVASITSPQNAAGYAAYIVLHYTNFLLSDSIPAVRRVRR